MNSSVYQRRQEPKAVRQLKARTADAVRFVEGSGTHHRTTGGSHTSGAREKHTKAARNKSFVRDYYVRGLAERIAAVERLPDGRKKYGKVLDNANRAITQVKNK